MILSVRVLPVSRTYLVLLYFNDLAIYCIPHLFPISRPSATYLLPDNGGAGMRARLTKRAVEGVPVGDKDVVIWDTEIKGFGVKVTPAGRRSYFLYYRAGSGQQRRPTI